MSLFNQKLANKDRKYRKVGFSWQNETSLAMIEPLKYSMKGMNAWRNYEIVKWLEHNIEKARCNAPKNELRCGKTMKWYIDSDPDFGYTYDTYVFFRDDVSEETIVIFVMRFG